MKLLLIPLAVVLLLALVSCDTETSRTRAEAQRLTAQAQADKAAAEKASAITQAEALSTTTRALIDTQNARIGDYRAILILAFVLAAGAMALSLAIALILRNTNRQPQIVYQITAPAGPQAQIGTTPAYLLPEERAKQRAVAQVQARNDQRYTI